MDIPIASKNIAEIKKTKRLFYLDVLRVIACLCVIMIHASACFVEKDFGSSNFWFGNIIDSLSHVGVPLFVMISGSIFLDENYEFTSNKMINHIKKMAIFFAFWSICSSLLYNLIVPIVQHKSISLKSFLFEILSGHYHLWFCFMIVGLYLIVPLLRLWVKKENINLVRYFIILALIFTMFLPSIIRYISLLFPTFSSLNSIIDNINIKYVGGYTVYFILGWYLNNYEIKYKKALIIFGILSVAISIFGTAVLSISLNEMHDTYNNLSVHIAFQAIMVYVLIKNKYYYAKESGLFCKAISFISKHSLGIYAIHLFILDTFSVVLQTLGITGAFIRIPIAFIGSFIISLLCSFLLSRIPLLKKVV